MARLEGAITMKDDMQRIEELVAKERKGKIAVAERNELARLRRDHILELNRSLGIADLVNPGGK